MKNWFTKGSVLVIIVLLVLVLVPSVSAESKEWRYLFSGGSWVETCDTVQPAGFQAGLAAFDADILLPDGFQMKYTSIYQTASGDYTYSTEWTTGPWEYTGQFLYLVDLGASWKITYELFDNGGGLLSTANLTVNCVNGSLNAGASAIYGPKVPKGFELHSLSCSSAVLDVPGGQRVGGNAVWAGQTWFVNPTPKAGPDGQNYTEIFVGGWKTGFIPTVCVGGIAPSFSAE